MDSADERLRRERAFHDHTFSEAPRTQVDKFYAVAEGAFDAYRGALKRAGTPGLAMEYGVGSGGYAALDLARDGWQVTGIDISPVATDAATQEAHRRGLGDRTSFHVMNAEQLEFPDRRFDLICGTGILHHLDLRRAFAEVARTLTADGSAIFLEPLGHNPLINAYRRRTPALRTVDEHPLRMDDLQLAAERFGDVQAEYFHLAVLAAAPFAQRRVFARLMGLLTAVDRQVLERVPATRRMAWMVLLTLRDPA